MITGIEHVAIYCKNSKMLSAWYAHMFDGRIVFDNGKGTYFVAFSDNSMLEFCLNRDCINEITFLEKPGIRHIAFSTDNFEETAQRLREAKVTVIKDVPNIPSAVKIMFFRDPEGNILHIISRDNPLI